MAELPDGLVREDADGVAVLTIDRPAKKNALTGPMLRGLIAEVASVGRDDSVRAVVLTGAGGAFCAGADVSALRESGDARPGDAGEAINSVKPAWWLVDCPKPVVAAIDGVAIGLGAEIATQADIRIATPAARIAWNFVHMGLIPDTGVGTSLLPRIVGLPAALEIVLSGEFVSAERAFALGLFSQLVEPAELLDVAVSEARRLSRGSRFAARHTKALLYRSHGLTQSSHLAASTEALAECFGADDYAEAVAAFLERRPPSFSAR